MGDIVVRLKRGGKAAVGESKLFGSPDVPDGFEWPAVIDDANCYDLDFLCQLNCADLAEYDRQKLLPQRGMLYFFYDFEKSSGDVEDKNSARVVYCDSQKLEELMMVDDEGRDCALCPPRALSFSRPANGKEKPNMLVPLDRVVEEGYTSLFCISSFRIESGVLHFSDVGRLWFLIDTKKLKKRDFSDVRTKIVLKPAGSADLDGEG